MKIYRPSRYRRFGISDKCGEQAFPVYEAHEGAHAASNASAENDAPTARMFLALVSEDLATAPLSPEEREEANKAIEEAKAELDREARYAVFPLGRLMDMTKEVMFRVAVECECGKTKREGGEP